MNRRGFLGALGVGGVAGPNLTKKALDQLISADKAGWSSSGGYANSIVGAGETCKDWRVQEVMDLKRRLSGLLTEEEALEFERRRLDRVKAVASENVTALRSVSASYRERMGHEAMDRIDARVEQIGIQAKLVRYALQGFK